ncbi:MAG TPA: outer membrane beta-barrel protein [Gammaproteobacteria bacterium]|nr:outer membrane beta-barrel protein [Gammaproteobacteria bacterium]
MSSLKTLFAIMGLSVAAISSAAAGSVDMKGLYVDGSVGVNFTSYSFSSIHSTTFSKAGINVNAGYKVNDYLAPEIGYTYYGIGLNGVDVALKGMIPLNVGTYGASIFGKVGAAHLFTTSGGSSSVTDPMLGAGFAVGVSKNVDWTVQANAVIDSFSNYSYSTIGLVSTGLTYNFG